MHICIYIYVDRMVSLGILIVLVTLSAMTLEMTSAGIDSILDSVVQSSPGKINTLSKYADIIEMIL